MKTADLGQFWAEFAEFWVVSPTNSNLYHYAGNNPVRYVDPDGMWFGADDVVTGPIDEIAVLGVLTIIGAISIYNSDENNNL